MKTTAFLISLVTSSLAMAFQGTTTFKASEGHYAPEHSFLKNGTPQITVDYDRRELTLSSHPAVTCSALPCALPP